MHHGGRRETAWHANGTWRRDLVRELQGRIKIIDSLGPSTIQPVAASERLPSSLRENIAHALLTLHEDRQVRAVMEKSFVDRFVRVDDSSYNNIRMMLKTVQDAGFTKLQLNVASGGRRFILDGRRTFP
jgi:ABC-type phosphate/phosphonate transport system substrate-binding protein